MSRAVLELPYGRDTVSLNLPARNLLGALTASTPVLPSSDEEEIERALDNPTGSAKIEDLARPGMKVVVMASDVTRPCPTWKLLPPLLERLRRAGVHHSDVTIMFGMGIHRGHTEDEKRSLVGPAVYERYTCVDSNEAGDFVFVGTTWRGTPVEVARPVAECDLLIATGNVEYHYFAGYSGGAKAVVPGAASRSTIEANHSMQFLPGAEPGSYLNNPVRQDIEEAAEMVGLDFILNVVLDEGKRIVRAVSGNPKEAHAEARRVVDYLYSVEIDRVADIVVASAGGHPKDINLYQAQKALENATCAVRRGGTVVLVAECPDGPGERTFEEYMTKMSPDEIIEAIRKRFVLGGHKAAALVKILKKAQVYLVSAMERELVEGFKLVPFSNPEEALRTAFGRHGPEATVWAIPYAGSVLPRLRTGGT